MKIAGYKIKALFIKDIKNLFRNPNVAFMLILPIGFAFFYSYVIKIPNEAGLYVFDLCTVLNMGVVPISIVAMSIAEEKEKNTLRTLMLSNVSAVEFMIAKLVLGIVMFLGVNILVYFICGVDIVLFPWIMFVVFVTSLSALMFGAVIGLISKDQMATGYYSTPVMLLFMAPIFGLMSESIAKVTQFIPTHSMIWLQEIESTGELLSGKGLFSIGVIIAWMIISLVVFKLVYKKNSLDN